MSTQDNQPPFKEYRSDGWPLCPKCGYDELYRAIGTDDVIKCLACKFRWQGTLLERKKIIKPPSWLVEKDEEKSSSD